MPKYIDKPNLDEPWAKRLRVTPSRTLKNVQGQPLSDGLPSPKPTNPSSTDNAAYSSSAEHRPRSGQKPVQSLLERLAAPPKQPTLRATDGAGSGANKEHGIKPSVAPFFRRIQAAFQEDKPATAAEANHGRGTGQGGDRSPSPDAEDLIKQLKEHYLRTATDLHTQATMRLSQTHSDLNRKLTQSLVKDDEAFLVEAEQHIKALSQPLDRFRIRSQQRDASGVVRSEENSVGELVSRAEEQVQEFEKDVAELWKEWAASDAEVKTLLKSIVASAGEGLGTEGCADDNEGEEILRRSKEAIEKEIMAAEEEVALLGDEALRMMKEIEKDFRKATLPDLHIFFQSIDEP